MSRILFFVLLALAGSETSRNAISQGLIALMEHPDQLALFRGDSGVRRSAISDGPRVGQARRT